MFFKQLRCRNDKKDGRSYLFIKWYDILNQNGVDKTKEDQCWEWDINTNKLSFKLEIIL